jgi:hypothetical protein
MALLALLYYKYHLSTNYSIWKVIDFERVWQVRFVALEIVAVVVNDDGDDDV